MFDICQADYSIYTKLRIFPYSEGKYNIQANNRLTKIRNLMFLFFRFLCFNVPDNRCHKRKWRVLFFTCIKLVMHVLVCAHAIAYRNNIYTDTRIYYFKFHINILYSRVLTRPES